MAETANRDLEPLVQEYLARATQGDAAVETRHELVDSISKLDGVWWDHVTQLVVAVAQEQQDRLMFTKYQRTLVDLGLLDPRLVPDGEEQRVHMLRELYDGATRNFFHFSEWLAHRYRWYILHGRLEREREDTTRDRDISEYREARRRIYTSLTPLLENVPGFPPRTVQLFVEGRLDDMIHEKAAELAHRDDRQVAELRKQLSDIKTRLLAHARERATPAQLPIFDALSKLENLMQGKTTVAEGTQASGASPTLPERVEFIKHELRLVRSLLKLGITGSGLTRVHSVLLSSKPRITKIDLRPILERVKELDPRLPIETHVLIAPYIGTGFYEWDRDTVFVPLLPTRDSEDAVVTALANYRLMLDNLQDAGRLKKAWDAKFGKREDFRTAFLRDYKAWVLGIGKGFKGALGEEVYEFFKMHVGPQESDLWAPVQYARLTPQEQQETIRTCKARMNAAEATSLDHYRLAICYWRDGRPSDCLAELAQAVKMYPVDGRMLFTLGTVCKSLGFADKAREALEECVKVAGGTLWHLYSLDVLRAM